MGTYAAAAAVAVAFVDAPAIQRGFHVAQDLVGNMMNEENIALKTSRERKILQ